MIVASSVSCPHDPSGIACIHCDVTICRYVPKMSYRTFKTDEVCAPDCVVMSGQFSFSIYLHMINPLINMIKEDVEVTEHAESGRGLMG